jgi:hypothetical protein
LKQYGETICRNNAIIEKEREDTERSNIKNMKFKKEKVLTKQ